MTADDWRSVIGAAYIEAFIVSDEPTGEQRAALEAQVADAERALEDLPDNRDAHALRETLATAQYKLAGGEGSGSAAGARDRLSRLTPDTLAGELNDSACVSAFVQLAREQPAAWEAGLLALRQDGFTADELRRLERAVRLAGKRSREKQEKARQIQLDRGDGPPPLTDSGNAERFATDHAGDVLFAPGVGWHRWDDRRYRPDGDGETVRRATQTARRIREEALDLDKEDDVKAVINWALRSESLPGITATIKLAERQLSLHADPDDLDADPWILNVHNGIIDLRTGELRPHDRQARCTKLAGAAYDPDARSDRWDRFLEQTTGGDEEFAAYLQRAAGHTACGVTDEEVILFAHGPAATGKTTFLEALSAALGEYARTASFDSFLTGRRDAGGPSPDIARLAGARMALASEAPSGKTFNAARLKSLTGGDRIVARQMYRDPFEFTPRFTLWLAANERPGVAADDDGMWRRLKLLPFVHVVHPSDRDGDLKRRLTSDPDDLAAILAWTIQGALQWQTEGLGTCNAVERATGTYREDEDPLAEFLAARCNLADDAHVMGGELFAAYETWARRGGEEPLDNKAFARALSARGPRKRRTKHGARWDGIGLRVDGEGQQTAFHDAVTGDA